MSARFIKHGFICMSGFAVIILMASAFFLPYFFNGQANDINLSFKNLAPSSKHLFGTDDLGRDLLFRSLLGAKTSFIIGYVAATIDLALGIIIGSLAGFGSKKTDEFLMRLCDILNSVPYVLIIMFMMLMVNRSIFTLIIAISVTGWIHMARITRGQILQIRQQDYVLSAKALGASNFRIVRAHILPNARMAIITTLFSTIATAVFLEGFISFLGVGIHPPDVSLGLLINDGVSSLSLYPWRLLFPAGLLMLLLFSLNLLGEGIKDLFKPGGKFL